MNNSSTLEMKFSAIAEQEVVTVGSITKFLNRFKAAGIGALSSDGQPAQRNVRKFMIGENVSHDQYGVGRVIAQLPDGRLQVRFQGAQKSRLIFHTYLVQGC